MKDIIFILLSNILSGSWSVPFFKDTYKGPKDLATTRRVAKTYGSTTSTRIKDGLYSDHTPVKRLSERDFEKHKPKIKNEIKTTLSLRISSD